MTVAEQLGINVKHRDMGQRPVPWGVASTQFVRVLLRRNGKTAAFNIWGMNILGGERVLENALKRLWAVYPGKSGTDWVRHYNYEHYSNSAQIGRHAFIYLNHARQQVLSLLSEDEVKAIIREATISW